MGRTLQRDGDASAANKRSLRLAPFVLAALALLALTACGSDRSLASSPYASAIPRCPAEMPETYAEYHKGPSLGTNGADTHMVSESERICGKPQHERLFVTVAEYATPADAERVILLKPDAAHAWESPEKWRPDGPLDAFRRYNFDATVDDCVASSPDCYISDNINVQIGSVILSVIREVPAQLMLPPKGLYCGAAPSNPKYESDWLQCTDAMEPRLVGDRRADPNQTVMAQLLAALRAQSH